MKLTVEPKDLSMATFALFVARNSPPDSIEVTAAQMTAILQFPKAIVRFGDRCAFVGPWRVHLEGSAS